MTDKRSFLNTYAVGLCIFLFVISICSCKKEKQETENEKMPQFGTCAASTPSGRLNLESASKFTYTTGGGGKIAVDLDKWITIAHKDYENFRVEFWGEVEGATVAGNHENLNGKHMKDWKTNRRSVVFPDGAKVTMVSSELFQPIISITIYDAGQVHHFNATCQTLEYSVTSSPFASQLDAVEADGETSTFEITETGLIWKSIYTEDSTGKKIIDEYPIGELIREEPSKVNDFYDDPRMGHT